MSRVTIFIIKECEKNKTDTCRDEVSRKFSLLRRTTRSPFPAAQRKCPSNARLFTISSLTFEKFNGCLFSAMDINFRYEGYRPEVFSARILTISFLGQPSYFF